MKDASYYQCSLIDFPLNSQENVLFALGSKMVKQTVF